MYDCLIIGAGMSGLAAGIRLAMFGKRVVILERHYAVGGLNSYYRLEGRNYDVGLHALTNFAPRNAKTGPLPRWLRQLRISWDDLQLGEQIGSAISFPEARLQFSNDQALLISEIKHLFPDQLDNYRRLTASVLDYDQLASSAAAASAREALASIITNPLLAEMLLCPVLFYGSSREHDLDFGSFSVLFRAIFLEGLARPAGGIRTIIKLLVRKFKELGGELRLRAGVQKIVTNSNSVSGVMLDDGQELAGAQIISSAGCNETARLCNGAAVSDAPSPITFVEAIVTLDCQLSALGYRDTITFYNDRPRFEYRCPDELADFTSGILCSPNNYCYGADQALHPTEGTLRLTHLANFNRWAALSPEEYQSAKQATFDRMLASAERFIPEIRSHLVAHDLFTPKTIRHFTGHDSGAVYGAARKRYDAATHLANLRICGADQGYVGIVGAVTSGIQVANLVLRQE